MEKVSKSNGKAPEPYFVGYARVSTADQNLRLQIDALKAIGVKDDNLHTESVSAASKNRPALELAIKDLHPGDTFVVWRLDRLARSMGELYRRLEQIKDAGANLKSLTESFDFTSASGQLILGFLGLMAQFERQLTIERTKAGMAALKAHGGSLGAPRKMTPEVIAKAKKMLQAGASVADTAIKLKVSKAAIYSKWKVAAKGTKYVVTARTQ